MGFQVRSGPAARTKKYSSTYQLRSILSSATSVKSSYLPALLFNYYFIWYSRNFQKNVTSSFCDKTVTPSFVTILVTANFEFWNLNESVIQPCVRKLSNLCMLWNLRVTDFKLQTKICYCDNFWKLSFLVTILL